jgi:beta-lactamase regulating signal transducer with metallopeptidase domain
MESELLWMLLQANVAASLAILFVLPARLAARRAFGGRAAYALWLLAPAAALASLLPARHVLVTVDPQASAALPSAMAQHGAGGPVAGMAQSLAAALADASDASSFHIASYLPEILVAVWIAGAFVAAGLIARRQFRFVKSLGPLDVDLVGETCVLRTQRPGAGPALVGVLRPSIILPVDFETRYTEQEQDLILAHERMHATAGDAAINFLVAAMVCLCWFNPFIHLAAWFIRGDQEIACDTDVVANHPSARRTYAEALLKTQVATDAVPVGCAWPAPSVHPLRERIEIIGSALQGPRRRLAGIAVAVAAALAGGTIAWAAQTPVREIRPLHGAVASTRAAPALPRRERMGVDLREVAARLRIVSEDRSNYAVQIGSSRMLPKPKLRHDGKRLVVDGGLHISEHPCRKRFDGHGPVEIVGVGTVPVSELPEIVIHAPRKVDVSVDGVVLSRIGPAEHTRVDNNGCGDMTVAAATQGVEVALFGYGDVTVSDLHGAPLSALLAGLGSMHLGSAGDADLMLTGTGSIVGGDVGGQLHAVLRGAGDIRVNAVRADADLAVPGAGNIRIGSIRNLQTNIKMPGSGSVTIDAGTIGDLSARLSGPGRLRFGGEAKSVDATFGPDAPDIVVARAGRVDVHDIGTARGTVRTGSTRPPG